MSLTIGELYKSFIENPRSNNIEKSSIDILVEDFFQFKNKIELNLHLNDLIEDSSLLEEKFERLLNGEPVQYIINKSYFYQNEFYVDRRVLIPRMETEELIDLALKDENKKVVYDICTGSGCLGLTYKYFKKDAEVYLSDISKAALQVTSINAERLNLDVTILESDLFNNFKDLPKADLILCNPPYISKDEEIEKIVWDNEPHLALVPPSGDGLEIYERIFTNLNEYLNNDGDAYFEIGFTQVEGLTNLINKYLENYEYNFIKDMMDKFRILHLKRK